MFDQLPSSFINIISNSSKENCVIRSNISSYDLCDKWITEFSEITNTSWVVRNTKINCERFVYRKDYVCHHSSYQKVKADQNQKGKSKNLNCPAKIKIVIKKKTVNTIRKDHFIKEGLVAEISLHTIHSHTLKSAEALSNLKISDEVRREFENYFNDGLGISDAITYHEGKLELEGDENILANASLNPKYRTVQYLHDIWRKTNLGPRIGNGVIEKLRSKLPLYNEKGIKLFINEDPFAIVICTSLMQRAHNLPYSKDIVFVDSTASCDAHNHSITFMLTPCAIGAVPLAVIITKGQSFNDYNAGFELAQKCFDIDGFKRQKYPKIFITDDSEAERQALNNIWPQSKQLLCRFHVCQSVWRWLWSNEHNIEKIERPVLYKLFQTILVASTIKETESAYFKAIDTNNECVSKYSNWVNYINSYWKRREIWCLAYRSYETHGHQTNNFSEVCVRIYKDIVLSRNKAYNVVSLVDLTCTVMEQYYIRRIRKFANSRSDASRLFLKTIKKKIKYLSVDLIVEIDNHTFKVPSQSGDNVVYEVNSELGYCTCEHGRLGNFCKHQGAIYFFFEKELPNAPPITAECRHAMATLALGNNVPPLSFYHSLSKITHPTENLNIQEETTTIQNNIEHKNCNEIDDNEKTDSSFNNESKNLELELKLNTEKEFQKIIDLMNFNNSKFGSSTTSLQMFYKKLQNVKTPNSWETFLSTCGKQISLRQGTKSKIHVQPTSISRRRQGITRGSKRLAVGRPASGEKVKKIKRKRNLQINVQQNQQNAKSHGNGH